MEQLHGQIRSLNISDHDQVKETLGQFFQKLARSKDSDHMQWLNSLEIILSRFPKFCLVHRHNIETYLVHFLDSENEYWVIKSAKCCHFLQQVKSSNDKTFTSKSSWRQQMSLLCSTAHDLMGAAFDDAVDIYKATGYFQKTESSDSAGLNTPMAATLADLTSTLTRLISGKSISDYSTLSPAQKNSLLCNRLKNVLTYIQAMLVEVYAVAKPVRPQIILDVIVRALSITSGSKQAPMKDAHKQIFGANIAIVKTQALRALDALIICLNSNLIPYSPLIFRLVTQTLRWSADNVTEESREVRRGCYSTVTLWLSTLRCHKLESEAPRGRTVGLEEELLARVLADVTPRVHTVQLTMSNQSTKNLSKKAARKMANTILKQSTIANHIPGEKNKDEVIQQDPGIVLAALQCLEALLYTCGIFLKPTSHKRVQECVVRQCYALDSECEWPHGLALCRALEACRLSVPSTVTPPTHHCLHIYSRLATSPHTQISQFCSQGLLAVRVSLHGAPPTLSYAPTDLPNEKKPQRAAAVVSERNRAALVSLLGEDKLPPPKELGEIIIDCDFESTKEKVDDDENIVLSSSQSSIEVQIDESNGVDLDSPESNFEEPLEVDDFPMKPSLTNGKMRLIDFDKKNEKIEPDRRINDMATQLPNTSVDCIAIADDDSTHSIEISYDHSRNKDEKVTFLENLDGDNLPSTGETDDVQITCGQTLKSSQESAKSGEAKTLVPEATDNVEKRFTQDTKKTVMEVDSDEITEVNKTTIEDAGHKVRVDEKNQTENTAAISSLGSAVKEGNMDVEDMLADFVDEKAP